MRPPTPRLHPSWSIASALILLAGLVAVPAGSPPPARASHTPLPSTVTLVGSLQSELGCPDDWQPECTATQLPREFADGVWQASFSVPAGAWEYKVALNGSWDENYGANAAPGGANLALSLAAARTVKFYYSHETHWIADDASKLIAVAPGSFQSELGCPGDWQPDCLRSWLQDPDGNGIYGFSTTAIPAGSYETKVTHGEGWTVNYGAGGVQDGPNIAFSVPSNGSTVAFSYDPSTHILTITVTPAGHSADGNVEWDGLRHDSRDTLYRTPGGAVKAGKAVRIRLRTFHDDVTDVRLRLYSLAAAGQQVMPMELGAADVSCYEASLADDSCDFWEAVLPNATPDNVWYRFIVSDGADTDYYGDDTWALDGGLGATSDDPIDRSFALTVFHPAFQTPAWARTAVIYQIFPDRFRNGNPLNDPRTGDVRYDDPVLALPWGTLPEGYCRNYQAQAWPWRFDDTPPASSPTREQPRGRDYMGGDLAGVTAKLGELQALGVTAIYFNPIFTARSNHRYDTAAYRRIDHALGTPRDWDLLVAGARARGIRIIVDGVFNHLSSDSPFFDRFHHYAAVGACESTASEWRPWFTFRPPSGSEPAACVPSTPGGSDTFYDGWFGFDSIPVIDKAEAAVQRYFLTRRSSITRLWLERGAAGWRMDVMGDASFPDGYWETFRRVVKSTDADALIISETWQKDSTLLRMLRGDRADTTMNYRLRDAVLGLLAPRAFDSKGFADSGQPIEPSDFAARLLSVQEDYPRGASFTLMNLLDSHDTERLLWTLIDGDENTAGRESAAALEGGKRRVRVASLIQFTVPGAPTIYYGDEVGVTGDDDPDDRRTYPWADRGGSPDTSLKTHYTGLATVRREVPALTAGDLRVLHVDDDADTVAYGRRTNSQAAVVAVNRSPDSQTLAVDVAGWAPNGTSFARRFGANVGVGGGPIVVAGGILSVELPAMSALILATGSIDLAPPSAPANLRVTEEGDGSVTLVWDASAGAAGYNVYRSPLSGGGWVRANAAPITGLTFTDSDLENGRTYHYVVRALDEPGNESRDSNEVVALPHLTIGWANLQWPPTMTHTISTTDRTDDVYGQVWIDGHTNQPGPTPSLRAQLGFGPDGSEPAGNAAWSWVEAMFNVDAGNNDEFKATLLPEAIGRFDYAYRYTTTDGRDWLYADLDGTPGYAPAQAGDLQVVSSGDTTPPATPTGLEVSSASPAAITLAWDALTGDPTLYGYEVRRATSSGGPFSTLALVTGTSYSDGSVVEGTTYWYVLRSVDSSWNRSPASAAVSATAERRLVEVVFTVEVPATTDGTGRSVHIAGTLDRLDPPGPAWDPGGVVLTRRDATHWTITLHGLEGTQLEYKYALGSWDYVEKGPGTECAELANRQLELSYGDDGIQAVNDTVANWRNVAPCGN
jgi:glycosidase